MSTATELTAPPSFGVEVSLLAPSRYLFAAGIFGSSIFDHCSAN